jgi:hypothetical protein
LLACSIASAFRGPALVDVRRLFYIAAALGAWPFHERAEQFVDSAIRVRAVRRP